MFLLLHYAVPGSDQQQTQGEDNGEEQLHKQVARTVQNESNEDRRCQSKIVQCISNPISSGHLVFFDEEEPKRPHRTVKNDIL